MIKWLLDILRHYQLTFPKATSFSFDSTKMLTPDRYQFEFHTFINSTSIVEILFSYFAIFRPYIYIHIPSHELECYNQRFLPPKTSAPISCYIKITIFLLQGSLFSTLKLFYQFLFQFPHQSQHQIFILTPISSSSFYAPYVESETVPFSAHFTLYDSMRCYRTITLSFSF